MSNGTIYDAAGQPIGAYRDNQYPEDPQRMVIVDAEKHIAVPIHYQAALETLAATAQGDDEVLAGAAHTELAIHLGVEPEVPVEDLVAAIAPQEA